MEFNDFGLTDYKKRCSFYNNKFQVVPLIYKHVFNQLPQKPKSEV